MPDKNKESMNSAKTIKSPFKFLAPYSAEDKNAFWGRDTEIQELYEMLFATNMVLLYGPSGTGKTSLVQCGLSKKFSGPDWIPLMIRRGEDFVTSLKGDLQAVSNLPEGTSVPEHIIHIYNTYYRPVYLFFDQFEEIFTLADRDKNGKLLLDKEGKLAEVRELFTIIQQLSATLPCKVVFIFREEFLGQLYNYEQYLPNLFDFRLRVEPMNTVRIIEVLEGSFKSFNITCDPPEVANSIADNLLEGKATSQLAYLQVYMDKLWKTANKEGTENEWQAGSLPPPVTITNKTLKKVGDVQKVLEVYLQDQEDNVAKSLGIKGVWVRELLDSFVTDDGTKRPIAEGSPKLNPKNRLNPEQQAKCLTLLEEARLIRNDNQYYELAHDTLAGILANKRTASQRLVKEITQSIRTSYNLPTEGEGSYLNEEIVAWYDKYQAEIDGELEGNEDKEGIVQYIEDSRKNNEERKRNLEEKNIRLSRYLVGILVLFACAGILVIYALMARQESVDASNIARVHYWASDDENMNPGQVLRLMEIGNSITTDVKARNTLKKTTLKIFNASTKHRFKEKMRLERYMPGSKDPTWLITQSTDPDGITEFQVWEIEKEEVNRTFKVDKNLHVEELTPDGKWMLATNPNKDRYIVYDTDSKQMYALLKNEKNISIALFANNGRYLYTLNSKGQNHIWDLTNKKCLTYLAGFKGIWRVEFSKDSKWLLTSDENYTYKIWETATGKVPDFLNEVEIKAAKFSADGKWLLTTNAKDEIRVWDLAKRKQPDFLKSERQIKEVVFSENGEWVFTRNDFAEFRIWNIKSGKRHDFLKNETGIFLPIFSNDGKWFFAKNEEYQSFIWKTEDGEKLNVFNGGKDIWYAMFSEVGEYIYTKNALGESSLWSTVAGQVPDFFETEKPITDARFSADGKFLYTTDTKGLFKKWELGNTRNEVFPIVDNASYHEISADGDWMIIVESSGKYHLLDNNSDNPTDLLSGVEVIKAEFSDDGKYLVTIDKVSNYRVWKITRGEVPNFQLVEKSRTGAELLAGLKWNVTLDSIGAYHLEETPISRPLSRQVILDSTQKFTFGKYVVTISNHKIITKDTTDKTLQTLFVNTTPSLIQVEQNHLYVLAGNSLLKTDLVNQKGNLFSYGNRQALDYSYDEIKEWIEVFGDEFLGPITEQTSKKYELQGKNPTLIDKVDAFFTKLMGWIKIY